jgi:hypothetical protein
MHDLGHANAHPKKEVESHTPVSCAVAEDSNRVNGLFVDMPF